MSLWLEKYLCLCLSYKIKLFLFRIYIMIPLLQSWRQLANVGGITHVRLVWV